LVGLGVLVFIIAGVVGVGFAFSPASERRSAVTEASNSEVVDVTADDLHAAYKRNEVAADEKYRGKVLDVTGAVQRIRKDIRDVPYVELWTSNEFEPVWAYFQDPAGLSTLSAGRHITARCVGGNVAIGSPMLRGC